MSGNLQLSQWRTDFSFNQNDQKSKIKKNDKKILLKLRMTYSFWIKILNSDL